MKYDSCRQCGKNDNKHVALGLCSKCYGEEQEQRSRGRRPSGRTLDSRVTELVRRSGIDLEDYLRYEYVRKRRSMIDIAKQLGCTRQAVSKALKKFGIDPRTQSDAADLALRRGKKKVVRVDESGHETIQVMQRIDVNHNFFSLWFPQMAWVLGLVFTDGNIDPGWKIESHRRSHSAPHLRISQKDPEILLKVLTLMECNAKLIYSKERRYGSTVAGALYTLNLSSDVIYHDLVSLGVTPNKSLTMMFPEVPQEFVSHFIRGCWDGDGTVHVPKDGDRNKAYAGIVSGSLDFMTGMVQRLSDVDIKRRSGRHFKGSYRHRLQPLDIYENHGSYHIMAKGRDNLTNLFHYLYDGVDSSMRLERKYLNFLEIMRLYGNHG